MKITRDSILPLEEYARLRQSLRAEVMEHKRSRTLALGENIILFFEDDVTMRYQIQEMLRVERIFEEEGIQEELETYSALVPTGKNLKATMMIQYADPLERAEALARLIGIEDKLYMQVGTNDKIYAIADEDIDRENADKTSSVHFLRFEFSDVDREMLQAESSLFSGVEHQEYRCPVTQVSNTLKNALLSDFE